MRTPEAVSHRIRTFISIAVIVFAALAAAISPPPFHALKLAVGLATLISMLSAGVTYLAMRAFDDKKHLVVWEVASVVLVVGATVWILYYSTLSDDYVATYQGARVVIGSAPTEVGAAWLVDHGNESPSELLFDAHGDVYLFWTRESIARVYSELRIAYYAWFAIATLAVLSLAQAIALVVVTQRRQIGVESSTLGESERQSQGETQKSGAVIFVHGIRSSEKCWDELISLLEKDPRIRDRFILKCFGYDASSFQLDPRLRIPRLEEIGRALEGFLDSSDLRGRQLTLVGHSQGGLIILSYLADMVSAGNGQKLSPIRQVILIATPLHGSGFLSFWRKLFSRFIDNPQERQLRVLNPDMSVIMARVQRQVVAAQAPGATSYPVPIRLFYGQSDGIVSEASARGGFTEATPLPGNHSSVIRPPTTTDRRYTAIAEALLEPVGHPNVFEVALCEISLTVEPRDKKSYSFSYENGVARTVECDNWARIIQAVTFSQKNLCRSQYEFSYGTKQQGLIKKTTSYVDESPGDIRAPYDDTGRSVISRFTPEAGKTYTFELEVYKGFDEGQRNIARRLFKPSYYKIVRVQVDLKRYLAESYVVSEVPRMSIDNRYDQSASSRHFEAAMEGQSTEAGVWRWEAQGIREGVVRLTWDLTRSPLIEHGSDKADS